MTDKPLLGPRLTPPRGGLRRLQRSVQALEPRQRHTRIWLAASLAAGLAVMAVLIARPVVNAHRREDTFRRALATSSRTRIENGAFTEIHSERSDIRILLVGNLKSPPGR